MDPEQPQQAQKKRNLGRIVLVISLALNLAVAGLVAGAVLRDKAFGDGPRGFEIGLGPIGQALEREDRRAIGRAMRENRDLRNAGPRNRREALENLVQVLQAEPFDSAALVAHLDETQSQASRVQDAAMRALVDRIAQMSPEDRRAFAMRLEAGARRRN